MGNSVYCSLYDSARSAHLLRRPYENVQGGSIRPIAKRLEWPDAVTILPKAELYFCYAEREADTDLFSSVVHHIIGQQISTKAQATKQSSAGFVWSATTGKLYLWAVAGGAIPGMKDYALKKNRRK